MATRICRARGKTYFKTRYSSSVALWNPSEKEEVGSQAYNSQGVIQQAINRIKAEAPDMLVMTDVCLCEYTSHGHCGVIYNGNVRNDESLELFARMALSHVVAGADVVAPSDMMDGRVGAIRQSFR